VPDTPLQLKEQLKLDQQYRCVQSPKLPLLFFEVIHLSSPNLFQLYGEVGLSELL
jgi:hypothetical protein